MKTIVIIGILLLGITIQGFSMGHPHNMFAARKQLRAKTTSLAKTKPSVCLDWHQTVQVTKTAFSERLLTTLSQIRPARSY